MKILSKAASTVWLLALLVILGFASPVAASTVWSALPLFAYDGQNPASIAYDRGAESAVGYDAVSLLTTTSEKKGSKRGQLIILSYTTGNPCPRWDDT